MKNIILSPLISIILAIITAFSTIEINQKVEDINNHVVHYFYENYVYDIEPKDNYILVTKGAVVNCDVAPCPPQKISEYSRIPTRIY